MDETFWGMVALLGGIAVSLTVFLAGLILTYRRRKDAVPIQEPLEVVDGALIREYMLRYPVSVERDVLMLKVHRDAVEVLEALKF